MIKKLQGLRNTSVFAEERLVAEIQSLLLEVMELKGINFADLAGRMGVSKARVSQIFSDNQNFTLRVVAGAFHALGEEIEVCLSNPIEVKSFDQSKARERHWQVDNGHDLEFIGSLAAVDNFEVSACAFWEPRPGKTYAIKEIDHYPGKLEAFANLKKPDPSAWGVNVIDFAERRKSNG